MNDATIATLSSDKTDIENALGLLSFIDDYYFVSTTDTTWDMSTETLGDFHLDTGNTIDFHFVMTARPGVVSSSESMVQSVELLADGQVVAKSKYDRITEDRERLFSLFYKKTADDDCIDFSIRVNS